MKKRVRLTESDLRRLVMNNVRRILGEGVRLVRVPGNGDPLYRQWQMVQKAGNTAEAQRLQQELTKNYPGWEPKPQPQPRRGGVSIVVAGSKEYYKRRLAAAQQAGNTAEVQRIQQEMDKRYPPPPPPPRKPYW